MRPAGVAVLAAGAAAYWAGRQRLDLVLTVAAIWALSLLAMTGCASGATFLSARRALRRESRRAAPPLEAIEGHPFVHGLLVPRRVVPLAALPRLSWLSPPARTIAEGSRLPHAERIVIEDRAREPEIVRELIVEDLFGLWRFTSRTHQPCEVRALPDPGRLAPGELAASLATGDLDAWPFGAARGDFVDFRTYTRSDPARLILWKVYARSRQLLVRAPEPARSPEGRPLVYLVAAPADEAAAAAARVLLESGCLGEDLPFACDGAPSPTSDLDRALDRLAASSRARDRAGRDLGAALADPATGPGDPVLLIAPAVVEPWLDRVLPYLAASPGRFVVLAAADTAPAAAPWGRGFRLVARSSRPRPSFEILVDGLGPILTTGTRLVVADRSTGRLLCLDPATRAPLAARTRP